MPDPQFRLGEDVTALVENAQQWAKATFGQLGEAFPHSGAECQWCPLCQFAALVRGERPDVAEKLAVVASAVADVFATLMTPPHPAQPAQDEASQPSSAAKPEGVQPIQLAE
jgi:hypothetical protein